MSDLPARMQTHYCRDCGQKFLEEIHQNKPSPHSQVWLHRQRVHELPFADYVSCSRYCEYREQSEEALLGRRMYGKGVPHPSGEIPAMMSYEELFPSEKE